MKKALKIVSILLLCVLILLFIGVQAMFGGQLEAANSIRKLEEGLYAMEYRGDYGLEDLLASGGAASTNALADYLVDFLSHGMVQQDSSAMAVDYGCSTLRAFSPEGTPLLGRNFDWDPSKVMLVHTVPKIGYESVSTSCLSFLGLGDDWQPDGDMMSRMPALAAVYVTLDGMNEKGLCVADLMAGDDEVTNQDTGRVDLTTTAALRLLLDRAATVDEAIDLLRQYDLHSDIGTAHHFALADATGKAVAVEYIANEMVVTESPVLTNHYLAEAKYGVGSASSHQRFDTLLSAGSGGIMTAEQLKDTMAAVVEDTQWTFLFDPSAGTADFYLRENFDRNFKITLGRKDWITVP